MFSWHASAATRYVSLDSRTPAAPFTSWASSATNIQDALNVASPGDLILVTNGTYGSITVTNAVTVQSANGPGVTVIQGQGASSAYLADCAVLSGFTLTGGSGRADSRFPEGYTGGGALFCASTNAIATNCVFTKSIANYGSGAFSGTLNDCTLTECGYLNPSSYIESYGGGACYSVLNRCVVSSNYGYFGGGGVYCCILNESALIHNYSDKAGGGACLSTLNRCVIANTYSVGIGGGAYECTLNNCIVSNNHSYSYIGGGGVAVCAVNNSIIVGNSASYGGGAYGGTLNNCTVVSNLSNNGGGVFGGADATNACTLNNCIIYYNYSSPLISNYSSKAVLNYCCTTPMPANGMGNITNEPLFVNTNGWSDLRLQSNSPCINAGNNALALAANLTNDLDGNPRYADGVVDIGAYEYKSSNSVAFRVWLAQLSLSTDGVAELSDPDGDGMNNWQEWVSGTDPTDWKSTLRVSIKASASTQTLTWTSVTNRTYSLERSTNLSQVPAFITIKSGISGQAGLINFTDTNAPDTPSLFYRVVVK